jgi:hypothetical protein
MKNNITSLQLAKGFASIPGSKGELHGGGTAPLVKKFLTPEIADRLKAFLHVLSFINEVRELIADRESEQDCWSAMERTAIANNQESTPRRLTPTVTSTKAARIVEHYMSANGIGASEFAVLCETTDRTLRRFRRTGKIRRDILHRIAKVMGTTFEGLLR